MPSLIGLTRFKQRTPDGEIDGPVSGALQVITIGPMTVPATSTKNFKVDLPAGCRFRVTDASFRANSITGAPTIVLGLNTNGSSKLVASVAATTNLGALTVKTASQNVPAGNVIVAQLAATLATRAIDGGIITLVGHISAPPTTTIVRNASHF